MCADKVSLSKVALSLSSWQEPAAFQKLAAELNGAKKAYARRVIGRIAKLPLKWRWTLLRVAEDVSFEVALEAGKRMAREARNKKARNNEGG